MIDHKAPMLFHKTLQRAIGPLDAEHIAHVITISTSLDDDLDLEEMEHEFLLFLIINEINNTKPEERSFSNIDKLVNPDDISSLEPILKHTISWKKPNVDNSRELAAAGVKDRLLIVMQADNPNLLNKSGCEHDTKTTV